MRTSLPPANAQFGMNTRTRAALALGALATAVAATTGACSPPPSETVCEYEGGAFDGQQDVFINWVLQPGTDNGIATPLNSNDRVAVDDCINPNTGLEYDGEDPDTHGTHGVHQRKGVTDKLKKLKDDWQKKRQAAKAATPQQTTPSRQPGAPAGPQTSQRPAAPGAQTPTRKSEPTTKQTEQPSPKPAKPNQTPAAPKPPKPTTRSSN